MGRLSAFFFFFFFSDTCKHLVVSHLRSLAGRALFVPNHLRAERKRASPPSEERWPCLRGADADPPWPSGPRGSCATPLPAPSSWRSSAAAWWCCHPAGSRCSKTGVSHRQVNTGVGSSDIITRRCFFGVITPCLHHMSPTLGKSLWFFGDLHTGNTSLIHLMINGKWWCEQAHIPPQGCPCRQTARASLRGKAHCPEPAARLKKQEGQWADGEPECKLHKYNRNSS